VIVVGLDPGPEQSALVVFNGLTVEEHSISQNEHMMLRLLGGHHRRVQPCCLVIEQIESFGMSVGKEVFETVFWTGRFAQAWLSQRFDRVPRRIVKQHLCHTARATDANIRQALIDRFGPGTEKAIGSKKVPGPLYGIKSHEWSALAVAVTWFDQHGHEAAELRPGIRPEF
jgi:hypothetical protein